MIFELACGRELSAAVPTDKDYNSLSSPVRNVLKTIFDNPGMVLDEVLLKPWFNVT